MKEERSQSYGDLSGNEKRRIYRALYRFELFRALFAEPRDIRISPEARGCFDAIDQSLLFLSIFKTWEVEELACVRDYITRRHTDFFRESFSELSKLCPNKDLNDGKYFLSSLTIMEHLTSLGSIR